MADQPIFQPAGDFRSVDGMLKALGVADAPHEEQRGAVRKVARLDSLRPILEPLPPELRRRGLI